MKIKINHNLPKSFTINDFNVNANDVIELTESEYNTIDIYWKQYITILEVDKPKVLSARQLKQLEQIEAPKLEPVVQEPVVEKLVVQEPVVEKLEQEVQSLESEIQKQKTNKVPNKKT